MPLSEERRLLSGRYGQALPPAVVYPGHGGGDGPIVASVGGPGLDGHRERTAWLNWVTYVFLPISQRRARTGGEGINTSTTEGGLPPSVLAWGGDPRECRVGLSQ